MRYLLACFRRAQIAISGWLQPADDACAQARDETVPGVRVLHYLGAVERWAQDRRMGDFAAQAAADAAVVYVRDRIHFERIG